MAAKKTKRLTRDQLSELTAAIDLAGELQAKRREAMNDYEVQRGKLQKLIVDHFGAPTPEEGRIVLGEKYEACFCFDIEDRISPTDFLDHVSDPLQRYLCMRVILEDAKRVVGRLNYRVYKALVKPVVKEEPTLHISPRS